MPRLLARVDEVGLTFAQVKEAMRFIGYDCHALHMLDRWESKRTTGNFDRWIERGAALARDRPTRLVSR